MHVVWCKEPLCSRQRGLAHQHSAEHGKDKKRANSSLYSTSIKVSELKINAIAKRVVGREAMGLHIWNSKDNFKTRG